MANKTLFKSLIGKLVPATDAINDGIAIIVVLGLSAVIIPAGAAVAYLLIRTGQALASKTSRR